MKIINYFKQLYKKWKAKRIERRNEEFFAKIIHEQEEKGIQKIIKKKEIIDFANKQQRGKKKSNFQLMELLKRKFDFKKMKEDHGIVIEEKDTQTLQLK
ncbi:hypothetical protein [Aureivirga marina]|uniref:hypothetical protein n=1 Tax=Aureivirga marina TaxID=1182451 RepID=UPI0018CB2DF3|nr:hypothetical protein [Aureivirga marina]